MDRLLEEFTNYLSQGYSIPEAGLNKELLKEFIYRNFTLIGEFSELLTSEKQLKLLVQAQLSIALGENPPVFISDGITVFRFKCNRVGELRTVLRAKLDVPEVEWMLDDLWQEMHSVFEVIVMNEESASSHKDELDNTAHSDQKSLKQKGRYRLTDDQIKLRRKIVRDAIKRKQESPLKTWKEVARELDIPERTLRDWRHNPIYK